MAEMSGHDRHDNVWVDFSVDFSKWKGWAVMLVSLNMMAFRLLWNWSLESLVGLLTDSMRPHTVRRLFHFKNGPLNLSKSEQFASPQGKLLPYLKTLFTMFLVLLAQFSQIISGEKHSLSSFTPTRISKFHASWRLTCMQTRNFKDFLNTLYKSCFFRSWRDTHLGNNFLWGQVISIFTPSSHWELFISVCCQTTYQTNVVNNIFSRQHYTKRIQSSADGTSRLMTSSLTCLWAFSRASVLTHQSTCGKSNQFTNLQTHSGLEGILSNYMYLSVQEEGFPVWTTLLLFAKLLLWILTCLTSAQLSHTHIRIGPIMRWSHILVTLMDIRTSFCALIRKQNIPINGLDDVLASCNAG